MLRPRARADRARRCCSAVVSVALSVLGPKLLGHATDLIFAGVIGQPDPGRRRPRPQAVAAAARAGQGHRRPTCSRRMHVVPGQGIDFDARRPGAAARSLVVYVVAVGAAAAAGPADHHDRAARGVPAARAGRGEAGPAAAELLRPAAARRGAQPGHQRHRQPRPDAAADAEPAGHLAADHRRRAGHDVLDLAAAGADRAGHRAGLGVRGDHGSASGPSRSSSSSGRPPASSTAHIEEMYTGHALVKVFGRQQEAAETFAEHNEELYASSFRAQFISGLDPAGDDVHRQPQLRAGRRGRRRCGWPPARCRSATCRRSSSTRGSSASR